jgi:multidrug efflux pump subunit AcrA (membrane-fusion protein)
MELQIEEIVHKLARPRGKRRRLGRGLMMVVVALGLIAIGALGATLASRYLGGALPTPVATTPTPSESAPPASELPVASAPASLAGVVLSPEAVSRTGIKTAPAEVVASQATIQLPGTVLADAYREVKVVPIVGGIVTKVHVELGVAVKRGKCLGKSNLVF